MYVNFIEQLLVSHSLDIVSLLLLQRNDRTQRVAGQTEGRVLSMKLQVAQGDESDHSHMLMYRKAVAFRSIWVHNLLDNVDRYQNQDEPRDVSLGLVCIFSRWSSQLFYLYARKMSLLAQHCFVTTIYPSCISILRSYCKTSHFNAVFIVFLTVDLSE